MTVHLLIFGSVQGVGYRQFIKSNVLRLGLTGWVKNLLNGTVEAVLQGDKKKLDEMIKLCKKGSFLAEIEDIHITWNQDEEIYEEFVILPS